MGKKQHQKDKLYLTTTEWAHEWGGKRVGRVDSKDVQTYKRLPFDHCSLSLQPWKTPYCDREGNIYDLANIVPFVKKFKVNPVSGKPMATSHLLKLNVVKNADGKPHCPVMYRVFNDASHIVAIATTGNVFSYDAVSEMNIKPNNWRDLVSDKPFKRSDIITLEDKTTANRNLASFHHVKHHMKLDDEAARAVHDVKACLKNVAAEARETFRALDGGQSSLGLAEERQTKAHLRDIYYKAATVTKADSVNAASYSQGRVAASLTSTVMETVTQHEAAVLADDVVRYGRIKDKGYVRLVTNVGNLNIELHCDHVQKTCENFIMLAKQGYYDGTTFHRSIKHFMIQGGDPTGTGHGGETAWGAEPFADEFKPFLTHDKRGILAMANSGPNTNKSQFYITFRPCPQLDGKHTVFGHVVGGLDTTLRQMEAVETDNKDRPVIDLTVQEAVVFVDPFAKVDEEIAEERAKAAETNNEATSKGQGKRKARPTILDQQYKSSLGVGQFIDRKAIKLTPGKLGNVHQQPKAVISGSMNFDSWT